MTIEKINITEPDGVTHCNLLRTYPSLKKKKPSEINISMPDQGYLQVAKEFGRRVQETGQISKRERSSPPSHKVRPLNFCPGCRRSCMSQSFLWKSHGNCQCQHGHVICAYVGIRGCTSSHTWVRVMSWLSSSPWCTKHESIILRIERYKCKHSTFRAILLSFFFKLIRCLAAWFCHAQSRGYKR